MAGRNGGYRKGVVAVPVPIEQLGQPAHDGPAGEGIEIDEVLCRPAPKVPVTDVAPARHGHDAVGDHQFVVHAPIDAIEVEQRAQQSGGQLSSAHGKRIEQPHLDVVVGGKREQQLVITGGIQVVDQQAHAHAALCRIAQLAQEVAPGRVVLDLVILNVQRPFGTPG